MSDPMENKEVLSKEVVKWVEKRVAQYKRLRGGVVVVDVIPKTASGKILRKDLRILAKKEMELEEKRESKL
jgi:acyl-coenzyme A synthetase/AMP-(fatty) acid ligase